MKELLLLVKKNIVLLLRSKASALIVIFAPLLLILLIGLSYDNFAGYGLSVGFVSESVSDDINALQTSIEDQDMAVVHYTEIDKCLFDIEQNYVHACLELPTSFSIVDNNAKEVTFHLDQSRINVVWVIQEVLRNEFSLRTQEVSEQLVSNIFSQVSAAQSDLDSQRTVLEKVSGTQGIAASAISEVSISVSSDDLKQQDKLVSTFESFLLQKILDTEDKIQDLQDQIEGSNVSSSEIEEMVSSITALQSDVDDVEAYVGGSGTYSFGQIEIAIEDLQNSVSSALTGITSADTNLDLAKTDLDTVVSSLSGLSSNLKNFQVDDSSTISTPLVTNIELVSSEKSKFNYLFPSLLVLVVMFLSVMLGNTLVMMEKKSPAYIRNVLLPISKAKFIFANFLSVIVLVTFQTLILLLVSLLFVPGDAIAFLVILITLLFVTSVFGLIGMIIGSVFNSEETSILASISTGSLFLFLSGVILPIEGMSPGLREITAMNPFVIAEEVIRRVFIFGGNLQGLFEPYMILILYSIILCLVILLFDSFIHQHLIERFLYKKHKTARRKKEKLVAKKKEAGKPVSLDQDSTQHKTKKHRRRKKFSLAGLFKRRKKKEKFEL